MLLPATAVRIVSLALLLLLLQKSWQRHFKTLAFTHCSILNLVACSAETLAESFPGNPGNGVLEAGLQLTR